MSLLIFTGLACSCAGALCALAGDVRKDVSVGLFAFMALNLAIWSRFFVQLFSPQDLLLAAEMFLLSQALATVSYLGMIYFLDPAPSGRDAI